MPDYPNLMGPGGITAPGFAQNYLGSVIASPKIALEGSGEPTQRSITSIEMARDVVRTVVMAGRNRSIVNSRILAKYNAERPYDSYKLEAEGLGWRSNYTSKPLPSMIEKVAPRFLAAVDNLKYFTNASLSDKWQNPTEKTEEFRKEITNTIRARESWRSFLESVAFNNALFGHTVVTWLDRYSSQAKAFDQEDSFAADGTKSDAALAQIVIVKETLLPHELFDQIRNPEAATDAGFDLANAREAINTASPMQIRDRLNVGGTLETWYQNALRELTIGASYMAGNSVIVVYNLYAREVTGKVSHYRLAGPGMLKIQEVLDEFDCTCEAMAFFTYQRGNGTLHGSKGIGRDIYELAGMQDRIRNEVVDRLIMSGKTIIQGDQKRIHTFRMNVVGTALIIPTGWQLLEQKIDGNVDGFLKLDAYVGQLVDQLIGSVSVPNLQNAGEAMRSPAAWNLLASRQEEGRDSKITRFMEQFAKLIQGMQRKMCDPETMDEDAKEMQERLLEKMTREELEELANSSVAGTVADLTPLERQLIVTIAQEKKGNPLYNQRRLEVEDLTARIGADFAERLLLPDNDPSETAEQSRQQDLETMLLSAGHPVPVSPRDNHMIHLQELMPDAQQMAAQVSSGSIGLPEFKALLAHLNEHYNQAIQQGVKKEALAQVGELVGKLSKALPQLEQIEQQKQALAQQAQQVQGQDQGQPGGAPPSNVVPMPQGAAPPAQ
jgi:hypothetical protein